MDKQTLSNYGWVIITVLVLAVMIALATPFGTYVKEGAKSTLTGLFGASENALNIGLGEAGVTVNKAEFDKTPTTPCCSSPSIVTYDDDTKCANCNKITYGTKKHNGIIPEGAILEVFDASWDENYIINTTGEVLQQGDAFPETIKSGTAYKCGDYLFLYNGGNLLTSPVYLDGSIGRYFNVSVGYTQSNNNHWGVVCIYPGKTICEDIPETICNLPVTNLSGCFADSAYGGGFELVNAPRIPKTAKEVIHIFAGCNNLETATLPCHCYNDYTEYGPTGTRIPSNAIMTFYHTDYYGCDGSCGFTDGSFEEKPNENINKYGKNDPTLNHSNTIPEGATYTQGLEIIDIGDYYGDYNYIQQIHPSIYANVANATTYHHNNSFPSIKTIDKYEFDGVVYLYDYMSDGWSVIFIEGNNETVILESINGKPVTGMEDTYFGSSVLVLPSTIKNIRYLYGGTENVTEITFAGTKEQWNKLNFSVFSEIQVIHCTDGSIRIKNGGYIIK